jgi:hypothetical protein
MFPSPQSFPRTPCATDINESSLVEFMLYSPQAVLPTAGSSFIIVYLRRAVSKPREPSCGTLKDRLFLHTPSYFGSAQKKPA